MDLNKNLELEGLLKRYLDKKCTQEEKLHLYELLISSASERSFKEVLFSHLIGYNEHEHDYQSVDFSRIYNQILDEIQRREEKVSPKRFLQNGIKVKRLILRCLSIAAVFCIAFFLGTVFKQKSKEISTVPIIAVTFNEIKAPLGARSEVKLPDGTEVMLNAGSTIKYRSDFNLYNRNLVLEGEAYFIVAKSINQPLIVNAGKIYIKATGTEFNVKAYNDEDFVETTLIEGKVEISQIGDHDKAKILELKPNQKAIYANESKNITLEKIQEIEPLAIKSVSVASDKLVVSPKVDVEQVTAWTKNKLIIRGENLESLCVKLQRKYDVTIVFGNEEIKKYRFSGILLDETFEQVMNVIKLTAPIDYLIDGKTALMFSKKEQVEKYLKYLNKYKK